MICLGYTHRGKHLGGWLCPTRVDISVVGQYSDNSYTQIGHGAMIIGYARVSSTGQNEAAQVDLLQKNGAGELFLEKASGTNRNGRLALPMLFASPGREMR